MAKLSHKRLLLLLLITPILLIIELLIGYLIYSNIQSINKEETKNTRLDTYLRTNSKYISYIESAQRGYLLTGDKKFRNIITTSLDEIRKNHEYYDTLPADIKAIDISRIQDLAKKKLDEMTLTLRLSDAGQKDSALAVVNTGIGKVLMDSLRAATTAMRTGFTEQVTMHKKHENYLFSLFLGLIATLFFFNLFLVWYTYRKFLEYTRHLEQTVSSLQDANERMGQYTAMSYHELKTPLRNISGFAQLLKRRYSSAEDGSEESEFIRHITDGVRQMNQTINDMRGKYLDEHPDDGERYND
jgi:CHASE3 domain sensor protein